MCPKNTDGFAFISILSNLGWTRGVKLVDFIYFKYIDTTKIHKSILKNRIYHQMKQDDKNKNLKRKMCRDAKIENIEFLSLNTCSLCNKVQCDCSVNIYEPHAEYKIMEQDNNDDEKQQNVRFSDQLQEHAISLNYGMDPTRSYQDTYDADLQSFFSRPLKIYNGTWTIGGSYYDRFNPWALYFDNARVSNRLTNFNLMRANLKLKFVINGNGFYYSRMIASYWPFHQWDNLTATTLLDPEDLVQESQMPHIFLNPTTSTGGEITLPFFFPRNNFSVVDADWEFAGEIILRAFTTLKHANGATGDINISVFAWAEDVQLSVLTTVDQSTITPQADIYYPHMASEVDEANTKGMISGPATALSKAAGALSVIPQIKPFALATSIALGAVASVAKVFGYSRPALTKAPEPYRPTPTSSFALTTVPDVVQKLTVDDKQELTIDPMIAGMGPSDPLSIKAIAMTESYFTSFDWLISNTIGDLLFNARVDPLIWRETAGKINLTATAVACLPFKYWSGTLRFRFQIMCSTFHKGRLKITYDPNWVANEELNVAYSRIVDISEENDFTICVSNGQNISLIDRHDLINDSVTQIYSTVRYTSKEQGNGVIAVSVLNELSTPNSTANNDIQVNVFVSAGEDFEVYVPHESEYARLSFFPQMELFYPHMDTSLVPDAFEDGVDKPMAPNESCIGPTMSNEDRTTLVYTGESIKSFRQMLKRYNLHRGIAAVGAGARIFKLFTNAFPFHRGFAPGAINVSVSGNFNYCNMTLLNFLVPAFQGWRGSIRYKIVPEGIFSDVGDINYFARRSMQDASGAVNYAFINSAAPAITSDTVAAANSVFTSGSTAPPHAHNGVAYTTGGVNPNLEIEMPYYNNYRFTPGKQDDYTSALSVPEWRFNQLELRGYVPDGTNITHRLFVAAGEDFQVYYFTGMPPVYRVSVDPLPA